MQIPLLNWDDDYVPGAILRLPYPADIDDIVEEVKKRKPYAVVPPFGTASFTAQCAGVARDRMRSFARIAVAIPFKYRKPFQTLFKTLQEAGFHDFVFPLEMLNFREYLKMNFRLSDWYHVAGVENLLLHLPHLPEMYPGQWTWSEEEL